MKIGQQKKSFLCCPAQAVMGLEQLPTRHALVADERLAQNGIRQIPVKNYIVFYIINEADSAVTVVRILYGQRNWIDLL